MHIDGGTNIDVMQISISRSYPETGCITVMKAMSCGAIPITSRYTSSVLQDLIRAHTDSAPLNLTISLPTRPSYSSASVLPLEHFGNFDVPAHFNASTDSLPLPLHISLPLPFSLPTDEIVLDYDMGSTQALTDAIATNQMLFQKWVGFLIYCCT